MTRRALLVVLLAAGCVRTNVAEVCVLAPEQPGERLDVRALYGQGAETRVSDLTCDVEAKGDVLRVSTSHVQDVDTTPFTSLLMAVPPATLRCDAPAVGAGEHLLVYRGDELTVSVPGDGIVRCFPARTDRTSEGLARELFPERFDGTPE